MFDDKDGSQRAMILIMAEPITMATPLKVIGSEQLYRDPDGYVNGVVP